MLKFDANIEAVILRQSVQLQMNVVIRPGGLVGYTHIRLGVR
jgi:hypothetical protein